MEHEPRAAPGRRSIASSLGIASAAAKPEVARGATRMKATAPIMINALVPEFSVSDWRASLDFYCRLLGFVVAYNRAEEGFAFLTLGEAQLMIDQIGLAATSATCRASAPSALA